MRRALLLLRDPPQYRRDRFAAGLQAAGFRLCQAIPDPLERDVLVIWNRYIHWHDEARRFERAGATVLVAENSPLAGLVDGKRFALARSFHNDSTTVRGSDPSRWDALGVDLAPWRTSGEHVLVCPNRSFGTPGRIMPQGWGDDVCARLRKVTKREVRLRPHPGKHPPAKPLSDDLAGAWCTVIWSSSAGVHSLIAGVPVICEAPYWIAKEAAGTDTASIEAPPMPDRLPTVQRLAWAVWSADEIQDGRAFRYLLQ